MAGDEPLIETRRGTDKEGWTHLVFAQPLSYSVGFGKMEWFKNEDRVCSIGRTRFRMALYAHATSSIKYKLSGKYTRFQSAYGLLTGAGGAAVFSVFLDGKKVFGTGEIYSKGHYTEAMGINTPIKLDVTGVQVIELVAEGVRGGASAQSAWGDPKVRGGLAGKEIRRVSTAAVANQRMDARALKKRVAGEVVSWNPDTSEITLRYDFSKPEQLEDWPGGSIDEHGRLLAAHKRVESRLTFSSIKSVEYEGCFISGDGRVTAAFGDCVLEFGGLGPSHLMYQGGNWQTPVIKTDAVAFSPNVLLKGKAEIQGDELCWVLNGKVLDRKRMQRELLYPTTVRFGMERSDTSYDNVVIVGVLDRDSVVSKE